MNELGPEIAEPDEHGQYRSPLTGDKLTTGEATLFNDGYTSKQSGPYRSSCYICRDPDFARMGLPLCRACSKCGGHVAADDSVCDGCGHDQYLDMMEGEDESSAETGNSEGRSDQQSG